MGKRGIFFFGLVFSFFLFSASVHAAQYPYAAWAYRQKITLYPPTPIADYQLKITLTPENFNYSLASSSGADIRFSDLQGNILPYYIENWEENATSTIWVKIPRAQTSYLWLYYGNRYAKSQSNGSAVFLFFDDFENVFDWTNYGTGVVSQDCLQTDPLARAYQGNCSAHKTTTSDPNGAIKVLPQPVGRNIILEGWVNRNSNSSGGPSDRIGLINSLGNGYGYIFTQQPIGYVSIPGIDIDIRSGYTGTVVGASSVPTTVLDKWYKFQLIIENNGEIINNIYYPSTSTAPLYSTSYSDTTYSLFTEAYIFGGYDYWVDNLRIRYYSPTTSLPVLGAKNMPNFAKPRFIVIN